MTTMPVLTGTEKQVMWATDIRADYLAKIDQWIARMREQAAQKGMPTAALDEQVAAVTAKMASKTEASWWIDRRSETEHTLVRKLLKGEL